MSEELTIKLTETIWFFRNKKVQNVLTIILLLVIVFFGTFARLQNTDLLVDQTTGKNIPLALDPFYFLRLAETINEQGSLPAYDVMRHSAIQTPFTDEILPQTIVFMYKISKAFDKEITLQYIDIIYPVVFFVLGLITFFFLVYVLTNSKLTALISSTLLAFIPSYLYRTMAGFSDHESIGMFAFFLVLLVYSLSLKNLNRENEKET